LRARNGVGHGVVSQHTAEMSAPRRLYEQRMVQRRAQEATHENLSRYVSAHNEMKSNAASEPRIETIRRQKMQAAIRQDIRADAMMEQSIADAAAAARDRGQEEQLALAIDVVKRDELRRDKDIQRIREESEELRVLEAKLKAAYMNKEREAQNVEKKILRQEVAVEDAAWDVRMESDRRAAVEAMQAEDAERRMNAGKARVYLDSQIQDKIEKEAKNEVNFKAEKTMIDAIVDKIRQQDEDEDQVRRAKSMETQLYIKDFMKQKEQWRNDQISAAKAEEARIQRYAEEKAAQMDAWEASKEAAQFERDQIAEKIALEARERLREQEYMENLRNDLVVEEREEAMRLKEKEMQERRIQERLEMIQANENQQQMKLARAQASAEEEQRYREEMLAKFADDDRVEQMNAQKRRLKQAEHRREVERLIEARRAEFEAQKEAELMEREDEARLKATKQDIIEEQRRIMISEHAAKLAGYLPPGTIMSEADLEHFPAEFRDDIKAKLADGTGGPASKHGIKQTVQSYTIF
jgi:hypothetical protein